MAQLQSGLDKICSNSMANHNQIDYCCRETHHSCCSGPVQCPSWPSAPRGQFTERLFLWVRTCNAALQCCITQDSMSITRYEANRAVTSIKSGGLWTPFGWFPSVGVAIIGTPPNPCQAVFWLLEAGILTITVFKHHLK